MKGLELGRFLREWNEAKEKAIIPLKKKVGLKYLSKISNPKSYPIIHLYNEFMIDGVIDSFSSYGELLKCIYELRKKEVLTDYD